MDFSTPLSEISGVGTSYLPKLEKLGLLNVKDLLFYFPSRYEDFSIQKSIVDLVEGERTTISGVVLKIANRRSWHNKKLLLTEAVIEDETGKIRAIWFNQSYLVKSFPIGTKISLAGKVITDTKGLSLSNPYYEKIDSNLVEARETKGLIPIYSETKGITSRYLRFLVKKVLEGSKFPTDALPADLRKRLSLPGLKSALKKIHFPKNTKEANISRCRFALEDLLVLELAIISEKNKKKILPAFSIKPKKESLKKLADSFDFKLTPSQKKSVSEILKDLSKSHPMNRLLQGDVGSGKTAVAALSALAVIENGYQTALMAPTEILALQHFKNLTQMFSDFNINLGLITASQSQISGFGGKAKITKKEFTRKSESGEIDIIIGTHALIQKSLSFKNLGLAIIDEQHRFGIDQRAAILHGNMPNPRRKNAEKETEGLLYEDLTYKIRNSVFNVYKELGGKHKENVYQKALIEEFTKQKIKFDSEKVIPINYQKKKVGEYKPDFVIENKIILEIKSLPSITKKEASQVWQYLKNTEYKLSLLINFGGKKLEIKRIIYDQARSNSESSAFDPHSIRICPHLLSMTATPIPRTLALTIWGDVDISLINKPVGRKPIITKLVAPENRNKAYQFIRQQIGSGRQVFVVCPLVEDSDKIKVKSATEEYKRLKTKIFPQSKISLIHGKTKANEKEKIMSSFKDGEIDVLVATAVIEVGIDIPNASVIVIEGAERFGLAQIYQFRGRVGRGQYQSFCLLFSDSASEISKNRLETIVQAKDSFELAEMDLKTRGPGQFLGDKQSGLPDYIMEALKDISLVKTAKEEAEKILSQDSTLKNHPLLKEKMMDNKGISLRLN